MAVDAEEAIEVGEVVARDHSEQATQKFRERMSCMSATTMIWISWRKLRETSSGLLCVVTCPTAFGSPDRKGESVEMEGIYNVDADSKHLDTPWPFKND